MSLRPFSDKFDIVGSFLPSEELIAARNAFDAGQIDAANMRRAEDKAIAELVERQLKAGLPFVTSGELRRRVWNKDFYFGLGGIEKERIETSALRQNLPAFADLMIFKSRISYNPTIRSSTTSNSCTIQPPDARRCARPSPRPPTSIWRF